MTVQIVQKCFWRLLEFINKLEYIKLFIQGCIFYENMQEILSV